MTEAEKDDYLTILKLIEKVNPSDADKLDEIDARVKSFVNGWEFLSISGPDWGDYRVKTSDYPKGINFNKREVPKFTRSRDALKSIRPEGYVWSTKIWPDCAESYVVGNNAVFGRERLPNEELAELHSIIQAIAYERKEAGDV